MSRWEAKRQDFIRQIVVAVAAQRSCAVTSADPFQERLRRDQSPEFCRRIWTFAEAIAEAEPVSEESSMAAKLADCFEVLEEQLASDRAPLVAKALVALLSEHGMKAGLEGGLDARIAKQAADANSALNAARLRIRELEIELEHERLQGRAR